MTNKARLDADLLLDVIAELQDRIVEHGDRDARTPPQTDDLLERLAVLEPSSSAAAEATIEQLLAVLATQLNSARDRGRLPSVVAKSMSYQVARVLSAVATARVAPALHKAVTDAERELAVAESERAEALAELESAVAAGDLDAVMRLRPSVEITLTKRVDETRVAVAEAKLVVEEDVAGTCEAIATRATERAAEKETALHAAHDALTVAQRDHNRSLQGVLAAEGAQGLAKSAAGSRAANRDTIKRKAEEDVNAAFRRIAGLTPTGASR